MLRLAGSELDYYLQQKARQEPHVRKAVALKRFHGRMGLWENTAYRSSLLKVMSQALLSSRFSHAWSIPLYPLQQK